MRDGKQNEQNASHEKCVEIPSNEVCKCRRWSLLRIWYVLKYREFSACFINDDEKVDEKVAPLMERTQHYMFEPIGFIEAFCADKMSFMLGTSFLQAAVIYGEVLRNLKLEEVHLNILLMRRSRILIWTVFLPSVYNNGGTHATNFA